MRRIVFHVFASLYYIGAHSILSSWTRKLFPSPHPDLYPIRIQNTPSFDRHLLLPIHVKVDSISFIHPRENYWTFDKIFMQQKNRTYIVETHLEKVRYAIDQLDPEYRRLFYLYYDYDTLCEKRSINRVCQIMAISNMTFREKMDNINAYLSKLKLML